MANYQRGILAALAGIAAILIAAGVGAFYGSLHAPERKHYTPLSLQEPVVASYNGVTESLPDIALVPESVERALANPAPESGQDHERRDLAAQESMAVWAFYMALFAGWTAVVTTVGTFLIAKQVELTRLAVDETSKATSAVENQNILAEDTANRQLRAYLGFENITSKLEFENEILAKVIIAPVWKNYGQTPAISVNIFTDMQRPLSNEPAEELNFVGNAANVNRQGIIYPKSDERTGQRFIIDRDQLNRMAARESYLALRTRATYEDVFGKKWEEAAGLRIELLLNPATIKPGETQNLFMTQSIGHLTYRRQLSVG